MKWILAVLYLLLVALRCPPVALETATISSDYLPQIIFSRHRYAHALAHDASLFALRRNYADMPFALSP